MKNSDTEALIDDFERWPLMDFMEGDMYEATRLKLTQEKGKSEVNFGSTIHPLSGNHISCFAGAEILFTLKQPVQSLSFDYTLTGGVTFKCLDEQKRTVPGCEARLEMPDGKDTGTQHFKSAGTSIHHLAIALFEVTEDDNALLQFDNLRSD